MWHDWVVTAYTPTRFTRELVSRLRGLMARYDVNQAELALLCDVSQSQFSKMIRGTRPMTVDHMIVISEALGQDISEIIAEVQAFMNGLAEIPSPLHYVSGGVRVGDPTPVPDSELDQWGRATLARLNRNTGAARHIDSSF